MVPYRIYTFGRDGHIHAAPNVIECADDQEAIDKAQQAPNGLDIEVWQGSRLVVRLAHKDHSK